LRSPLVGHGDAVQDAVARALLGSGAQTVSSALGRAAPSGLGRAAPAAPAPGKAPARPDKDFLELGLTCAALGDHAEAVAAFRQALAIEPDCALARAALGAAPDDVWRDDDDDDQTAQAMHRPPETARLDEAERRWRARLRGSAPGMAEITLRDHLHREPRDAAALRVLADCAQQDGRDGDAARALRRALQIAPGFAASRHAYAALLFKLNRDVQAMAQTRLLLARDPDHAGYRILLGSCLAKTGDFAGAIAAYEAALTLAPAHVDLWVSYAQALKSAGRLAACEAAFRHVLALSPGHGDAYWGLQNLSGAPPNAADVAAMRALLAQDAAAPQRFALHYALGTALEKCGDHAGSFAQYAAGARLRRGMLGYRAEEVTARVDRTIRVFTPDFLAQRAGLGCDDPAPIFILGMPRAGSTLIEQILASHSQVEATLELPEIPHLVAEIEARARYPEALRDLERRDWAALGERYLARCRAYRRTDKPFFIDKLPGNWVETGLIHLILPRARIIDARRGAMATCFGAFKKYFAVGQDFSYDLNDLGRFYADYVRLMAHMDAHLPGRVHRVQYEEVVADTEQEVRKLLAYCGLMFEPGCLRFWDSGRAVSTASAQQVRQPIYREALEQWRHYEAWLSPLVDALGPAIKV
jgi:cytochrome c-type biogenesis protein CcmH/NrfG